MQSPYYNSETENIPKTPLAFFWYVSRPYKKWVFGSIFIVILASSIGVSVAYLFKLIVDAVESGDYSLTIYLAFLYPAIVLVEQLLFRLSAIFIRNWMVQAHKKCTDELSAYVMRHSHGYFVNRFAGSLLSKVNNVSGAIDQVIPDVMWTHLTALVSFVVTFIFMLLIDVNIALTFIGLLLVLFILNSRLAPKKMEYSLALASSRTRFRSQLVDVFSNIQAVRQFSRSREEGTYLKDFSTDVRDSSNKSWTWTEVMLFWNTLILFIFSLGMFYFLVNGWRAGTISAGDLILVLALLTQITGVLLFIGRAFNTMARAVGDMREGLEDLLEPYEINDVPNALPLKISDAQINWREVDFSFEGQSVFNGFSLEIPSSQRLGLVGHSGAGKSTFVSLLLRQHDLDAGSIEIDGQNIAKITQDSLRENIAVVPQEPALFHRTIKENIMYGKPDATDEEVISVAKKAQAHDFIMSLPKGYDTMVGERGVKLSGGQKQRVAIARAMIKDSPILILDEATSALDSESEVEIQKALEILMEGRTVIAIAHRLSTLRKMDRIIVLDKGRITEDGHHDYLSKDGGVYEKLWNHQAGGFLLDLKTPS
jgi:ATP-binding cassette subfamily B protein